MLLSQIGQPQNVLFNDFQVCKRVLYYIDMHELVEIWADVMLIANSAKNNAIEAYIYPSDLAELLLIGKSERRVGDQKEHHVWMCEFHVVWGATKRLVLFANTQYSSYTHFVDPSSSLLLLLIFHFCNISTKKSVANTQRIIVFAYALWRVLHRTYIHTFFLVYYFERSGEFFLRFSEKVFFFISSFFQCLFPLWTRLLC